MTPRAPSPPLKPARPTASRPAGSAAHNPYALNPHPEVVDPVWLLKALALLFFAAFLCGYLTLCVLFYQGQWQLVLHPTRSVPPPATIAGAPYQIVHFGVDESATPQLTGWWFPAPSTPGQSSGLADRRAQKTILYLPSGDGSLADPSTSALSALAALHNAGLNVFAFDYRGYGQSSPTRPNQQRIQQDAVFAWRYLTATRGLSPAGIVPFGDGIGAALATQLAMQHPEIHAIILSAPQPHLIERVEADPRTKLLPVRLLFHERFEIASLTTLKTPKLLILNEAASGSTAASTKEVATLYRAAADPKYTLFLPAAPAPDTLSTTFSRFLDR